MALQISFENDAGADISYWNIGARTEDFKNGGVEIVLYGYVNAAKRQAGKNPGMVKKIQLVGSDYSPEMSRAAMYAVIKTLAKSEFAAASDV